MVLILPTSFCIQQMLDNRRIYVEKNQYYSFYRPREKNIYYKVCPGELTV